MLKKMWKDEEGVSPVIAVILMVAITVVLAAVLYVWASSFATGDTEEFGEGHATVIGDNYKVDIISMNQIDITETKFQLLDQYGGPKLDSDGEAIYGEVDDITVIAYASNQSFYEDSSDTMPLNDTATGEFYYYVVFQDVDNNGKMNAGDTFLIKGTGNGGKAGEDDVFRVKSDRTKKTIWEVELPAA